MIFDEYENGYSVGWTEGRYIGYEEGRQEAFLEIDDRLSKYWVELQILNARVSYLEKTIGIVSKDSDETK